MADDSNAAPALTQHRIRALAYPSGAGSKKPFYVPDTKVERLYVRVFASGKRSFVIRYYLRPGAKRNLTLGACDQLSLQEAREKARQLLVALDIDGVDPAAARRERAAMPTFEEFLDRFLCDHADQLRSGKELRRLAARRLRGRWRDRTLDKVTVTDVMAVRRELADSPYEANRARDLVQLIFNKAVAWGALPAAHLNPAKPVPRFKERPRARVLCSEEIQALFAGIEGLDSPHTRVLFHVLLEVPFRRNEVMRARWDGYDAEDRVLRVESLADNKKSNPQPLTDALCAMLDDLERFDGCPFIFPNRYRTGPIRDIDDQWRSIRSRAGVENVRLHDLRRTIATDYARMGASEYQIKEALGHTTTIAARHYVHLAASEMNRGLLEGRAKTIRRA